MCLNTQFSRFSTVVNYCVHVILSTTHTVPVLQRPLQIYYRICCLVSDTRWCKISTGVGSFIFIVILQICVEYSSRFSCSALLSLLSNHSHPVFYSLLPIQSTIYNLVLKTSWLKYSPEVSSSFPRQYYKQLNLIHLPPNSDAGNM